MTGSGSTIVCIGSGALCCQAAGRGSLYQLRHTCIPLGRLQRSPLRQPTTNLPALDPSHADDVPAFLQEPQYTDLFVTPARLITRQVGEWYAAPARPSTSTAAEAAAAAAAVA